MNKYWEYNLPVHIAVARFLGIAPPEKGELIDLIGIFPDGTIA